MPDPSAGANERSRLRIGSLFSGYGGLDLAVEDVFDADTVWFSELNESVARVFAHHWPGVPNLGDITAINWSTVPPVDIICGGFPCQSLSTVGTRTGIAPGTASGLWEHMATAIAHLRPRWVVIENVRGLLSSPAVPPLVQGDDDAQRNPDPATHAAATGRDVEPDPWGLGDTATRPLRGAGRVLADLAQLGFDAAWLGLPASHVGAPHHRYRIFILAWPAAANPAGLGLRPRRGEPATSPRQTRHDRTVSPDHRPRPPRTDRLPAPGGTGHAVEPDRAALRRWGRYARAIRRWEHIAGRQAPAPALENDTTDPRPSPAFVEWLMDFRAAGSQIRATILMMLSSSPHSVTAWCHFRPSSLWTT